jgi:hypothetical protein
VKGELAEHDGSLGTESRTIYEPESGLDHGGHIRQRRQTRNDIIGQEVDAKA